MLKDPAQNGMFELVERDAWLEFLAAAPDDCAQALGISSLRLSDMGLLAGREVAIVEFNRAMCIGAAAPVTETELDGASAWLKTNAAPGWVLQVAPSSHTHTVHDWLRRRAMTPSGTGWAKFERGASPVTQVETSSTGQVRIVNREYADAFGQWYKQASTFQLPPPNGSRRYTADQDGVCISRMTARPRSPPAPLSRSTA